MTPETGLSPPLAWTAVALLLLIGGLLAVLGSLLERSGSIRRRHWAEEAGGRLQHLNESPARLAAFSTEPKTGVPRVEP